MGGSSKPKQQVADYYLSMHYGWCYAELDEIKEFIIGEKSVWKGSSNGSAPIVIDRRNMLGGPTDQGGYEGVIHILQGGVSQVLPDWMASKMDDPSRVPGFRGIFSVFLAGKSNVGGFYWGSNSPYIRDLWMKASRRPKGFYPEHAVIPRANPDDTDLDANPAHIIWEATTNTEWGSGVPASMIDYISMRAAADTLYAEGFGLTFFWSGQQPVEDFVGEVLRHIDATFDINPRTGLYTLNLIRGDYTTEGLLELTPDNFKLTRFSRRSWDETTNELTVSWTNPATESPETVTYHDLGNIAQQGGRIVPETLEFGGIRSAGLAMRVAQREAARRGSPLAAVEGVASRIAWDVMPGDVVLLTWPKRGIHRLPVRVSSVDRGTPGSPGIALSGVEDEFFTPQSPYTVPPTSGWTDPSVAPFALTRVQVASIPHFMLAQDMGAQAASEVQYPDTFMAVMAASAVTDAYGFRLMSSGLDITGAASWLDQGSKGLTPYTTLPQPVGKEVTSVIGSFGATESAGPLNVGSMLWVGTVGAAHELMLVTAIAENGNLTLQRACLDTVARAWPAGSPVWFYDAELAIEDSTPRSQGQQFNYRLRTTTSLGTLDTSAAPSVAVTADARSTRPYRPADVRIVGARWPGAVAGNAAATPVTWANRNRLVEVDQVLAWSFGNVSPEAGATISIQVLNSNGAVLSTTNGLSGTSRNVDLSGVTGATATIRVWSVRDTITSYQTEEHTFDVAGYGQNYGNYYGGV